METISTQRAAELIRQSGGKLFGVSFWKKSTGELRHMTARRGVSKGVTGAGMSYDPADRGLLVVHEFVSQRDGGMRRGNLMPPIRTTGTQFRMLSIPNIRRLKIAGKEYLVR